MIDSKRFLLENGITNIEVFAPKLPDEGKDWVELSTLLNMFARKVLDEAAERADIKEYDGGAKSGAETYTWEIDRESILQLKDEL